jgi:hypothetical protein
MEKTNEQIVKEYHEKLLKKREYAKKYYAKNKEKIAQSQKKRYLENKQKYQNYYLDNKERYKNYYLKNKEKIINVAKTYKTRDSAATPHSNWVSQMDAIFTEYSSQRFIHVNPLCGYTPEQWTRHKNFQTMTSAQFEAMINNTVKDY